jgi:hypothetical protein
MSSIAPVKSLHFFVALCTILSDYQTYWQRGRFAMPLWPGTLTFLSPDPNVSNVSRLVDINLPKLREAGKAH